MKINLNCVFLKDKSCVALTKLECDGCKFAKTQEEYENGRKKAMELLMKNHDYDEYVNLCIKYNLKYL